MDHHPVNKLPNFAELRKVNRRLQTSLKNLKAFNAKCREFLKTAAKPAASAADCKAPGIDNSAVASSTPKVIHIEPKPSAIATAYLQFKIIEALQPHPAYENDDGFQPLEVVLSISRDTDRNARMAIAEFEARGLSLLTVLEDLVAKGIVVKTGYEPRNGDIMIGLSENLGKRDAAECERTKIIADLAHKHGLRARWNNDGTGSLETSSGDIVQPAGCIWTLLSSLYDINDGITERPSVLH